MHFVNNVLCMLLKHLGIEYDTSDIFLPLPNATTCPLWTSWSPLSFVAEV
jgi:hypothetical protein